MVKLVVDGVNYSDGNAISDPFYDFQIIIPNKPSAHSRSFQVEKFTFILGASEVIFNSFNSFYDEIPTGKHYSLGAVSHLRQYCLPITVRKHVTTRRHFRF